MIELLNPTVTGVVRYVADVARFRVRYGFKARFDPQAAIDFAVARFCTPAGRRGEISPRCVEFDAKRLLGESIDDDDRRRLRRDIGSAEHTRLSIRGEELRLYRWPSRARRGRALLVHGWEGYALSLLSFVEPLHELGFEVVAFDHRAHGASGGRQSSLPDFVWDLEAVIEREGPFELMIGHSLGAAAMLQIVAESEFPPPRAVALAPFGDMAHLASGWSRLNGLGAGFAPQLLSGLERRYPFDPERVSPSFLASRIRSSISIVHDRNDPITPIESSQALASANSRVELTVIEGSGHSRVIVSEASLSAVVSAAQTIAKS
ncbi:MAG: alpha/beta fold hydrolase [Myxococcota bacterium]